MTRSHWIIVAFLGAAGGAGVLAVVLDRAEETVAEAPLEAADDGDAGAGQVAAGRDEGEGAVTGGVASAEPEQAETDEGVAAVPEGEGAEEATAETLGDGATGEFATVTSEPVILPQFDAVRLEPDGSGVIAGHAAPGAIVAVMVGGVAVAEAHADRDGAFVAFVELEPSDVPRVLSLSVDGGAAASESTVIVAPTVVPETTELAMADVEGADAGGDVAEEAVSAEDAHVTQEADGAEVTEDRAEATDVSETSEALSDMAEPGEAEISEEAEMAEVSEEAGVAEISDVAGEAEVSEEVVAGAAEITGAPDGADMAGAPTTEDVTDAAPTASAGDGVEAEPDPGAAAELIADAAAAVEEAVAPDLADSDALDVDEGEGDTLRAEAPEEADALEEEAQTADLGAAAVTEPVGEVVAEGEAEVDGGMEPEAEVLADTADVVADHGAEDGSTEPATAEMAEAESLAVAPVAEAGDAPVITDEVADALAEAEAAPELAPQVDVAQLGTGFGSLDTGETAAPQLAATTAPEVATERLAALEQPLEDVAPEDAPQPEVVTELGSLAVPELTQGPARLPVLMADADGVRVLQPALAPGADAEVLRTVALDAISYDPSGDVVLSGRATGGGLVRIYLNNAPVTEAAVGDDGTWSSGLPGVETGVYVLRVDQVGPDGAVISRIETPFQREERETIAAVLAEDFEAEDTEVAVRTVQPGNTLWGISQERYGEGILYVRVFEANRDLIRDPNLIYPGQILRIPEAEE